MSHCSHHTGCGTFLVELTDNTLAPGRSPWRRQRGMLREKLRLACTPVSLPLDVLDVIDTVRSQSHEEAMNDDGRRFFCLATFWTSKTEAKGMQKQQKSDGRRPRLVGNTASCEKKNERSKWSNRAAKIREFK